MLLHTIKNDISIIQFNRGFIKVGKNSKCIKKIDIQKKLNRVTGLHWTIDIDSSKCGTIYAKKDIFYIQKRKKEVSNNELVQKILKSFPDTKIDAIKLADTKN